VRKQNVTGSAAVVVILVAVTLFFAVFNKPAPPEQQLAKPVPSEPEISAAQLDDSRKGTLPLRMSVLFPPLPEDRMKIVRVARVSPDGPAGRAGLQAGDVVASFDGKALTNGDQLAYLLTKVKPDAGYPMQVVRTELDASGKPVEKKLTLTVTGIKPLPPEEQVKF
jgi:S1-C subfamily serine protease